MIILKFIMIRASFFPIIWLDPPICSTVHLLMHDKTYLGNTLVFHQQP